MSIIYLYAKLNKTRIKMNKAKATFTGRIHPTHPSRAPNQKPGVDIRAAKGEGSIMCEIK
jgi:hypothetical protein